MSNKKIKAIDIFSGCGGVSCGLISAGFEIVAAVEIEPAAIKVYNEYKPFSNVNVISEDICDLTGTDIIAAGGVDRDDIYLLAGCPPCQNFSFQNRNGKRKSEELRKELLFQFLRVIQDVYPPFILMENVPGIVSKFKYVDDEGKQYASNEEILEGFLAELCDEYRSENERYYVVSDVLNAADYGVPQLRKRFVLHAVRCDIYRRLKEKGFDFELPKKTHNKTGEFGLKRWKTVRDAIGDLPPIVHGEIFVDPDGKIHNHKCARLSELNVRRIQCVRRNGGSRTGLPDDLVLNCHKKVKSDGMPYSGYKDVYGIMDYDKPSPTLTGGCLSYTKGRFGHPTQDRAISIREAARLQSFPDDFIFENTVTSAGLQIGNAVPVKLVKASGEEFMRCIRVLQAEHERLEEAETMSVSEARDGLRKRIIEE